MTKVPLLNIYADSLSMHETIECIEQMINDGVSSYILTVNVDVIVKIENDAYLKEISDNADLVLIDGMPLVWISKLYKKNICEKISGSDLVPLLCERASHSGHTVFIVGGKDGVAEQAKINLEAKYKDIKIVGTYSPPLGFENNSVEINKMNRIISAASPDLLIVCFGCPKQEKWVYENYHKYNAKVSICAGGTVDFLAGNISRAPRWISSIGLEWLYRFLHEPRRLFKRYFIDDLKIIKMIWKYKFCKTNKKI